MNEYRRRIKKLSPALLLEDAPTEPSSEVVDVSEGTITIDKKHGGRPIGTTNKRKKVSELSLYAAKNEITEIFQKQPKQCKSKDKRIKKGMLLSIILPDHKRHDVTDIVHRKPA